MRPKDCVTPQGCCSCREAHRRTGPVRQREVFNGGIFGISVAWVASESVFLYVFVMKFDFAEEVLNKKKLIFYKFLHLLARYPCENPSLRPCGYALLQVVARPSTTSPQSH